VLIIKTRLACSAQKIHESHRLGVPASHTVFSWYSCSPVLPNSHTSYSYENPLPSAISQLGVLAEIVQSIRQTESTKSFVKMLLKDSIAQTREDDRPYSLDNFSYGTTPYQSYKKLANSKYVGAAFSSCRRGMDNDNVFAIFGSSIGLFSFFASLSDNVRTLNYELLPFLHFQAMRLKKKHKVEDGLMEFVNDDMLNCDLKRCRVMMLMSMCWDEALCKRLDEKLEEEVVEGGIVIDYTSRLDGSREFVLVDTVEINVSWNESQKLYIYEKKRIEGSGWVEVTEKVIAVEGVEILEKTAKTTKVEEVVGSVTAAPAPASKKKKGCVVQ